MIRAASSVKGVAEFLLELPLCVMQGRWHASRIDLWWKHGGFEQQVCASGYVSHQVSTDAVSALDQRRRRMCLVWSLLMISFQVVVPAAEVVWLGQHAIALRINSDPWRFGWAAIEPHSSGFCRSLEAIEDLLPPTVDGAERAWYHRCRCVWFEDGRRLEFVDHVHHDQCPGRTLGAAEMKVLVRDGKSPCWLRARQWTLPADCVVLECRVCHPFFIRQIGRGIDIGKDHRSAKSELVQHVGAAVADPDTLSHACNSSTRFVCAVRCHRCSPSKVLPLR